MPLYEFLCASCGPFEDWLPLSEHDRPAPCPSCHAVARRVISPPNLVRTSPAVRKARSLEEKSAHEPEVVVRPPAETGATQRRTPIVSPHPWAVGSRV